MTARPGAGAARSRRANPYLLDELLVTAHRSAAGVAWRWRTELALITATTLALWRLAGLVTLFWAVAVLGVLALTILGVPVTRRFIIGRFWCVVGRHRLQKLCWEARLHTRSGRLPLILWTRPTKVGERALVWCRAGICAEDFENRTEQILSACYARDARITRHPRWSHLVTIHVVRRDTLAASQQVTSPLVGLVIKPPYPATDRNTA